MNIATIATRIACALCILALGPVHGVRADEAYWQGVRSGDWNDRIDPGTRLSNWYSKAPPRGDPLQVPQGTAIFTPGASKTNLRITRDTVIGSIRFEPNAPQYMFRILPDNTLSVSRGVVNRSATITPGFDLLTRAGMQLRQTARFASIPGEIARSSFIRMSEDSSLQLFESSRGGDVIVSNADGNIIFKDSSSAERMAIGNYRTVVFRDQSTGDRAYLVNEVGGQATFDGIGPDGDGVIPIGEISNDGVVVVVAGTLLVARVFHQWHPGTLSLRLAREGASAVVAGGFALLKGNLVVRADRGAKAGIYKIIRAGRGRSGEFGSFTFVGPAADRLAARPRLLRNRGQPNRAAEVAAIAQHHGSWLAPTPSGRCM
jgi:hypothetical protein